MRYLVGFIGLLLLTSCGHQSSVVSSIVGTWVSTSTTNVFSSDGTFSEKDTDSTLAVVQTFSGTYSASDTILTVVVSSATPTISGLPKTLTYTYTVSEDTLTLTVGTASTKLKRV